MSLRITDLNLGHQSKETTKTLKKSHYPKKHYPLCCVPFRCTPLSSSDNDSDKSTIQHGSNNASPFRNPNILAKHHHSPSPIKGKKLGSMKNPIDVDIIASFFCRRLQELL